MQLVDLSVGMALGAWTLALVILGWRTHRALATLREMLEQGASWSETRDAPGRGGSHVVIRVKREEVGDLQENHPPQPPQGD